jgi:hypothetical protein
MASDHLKQDDQHGQFLVRAIITSSLSGMIQPNKDNTMHKDNGQVIFHRIREMHFLWDHHLVIKTLQLEDNNHHRIKVELVCCLKYAIFRQELGTP